MMKIPMFDPTRTFPIYLQVGVSGVAKLNNQLFILYVMVLKDGWNIYQVEELETHYDVWIAKHGRDHKCITLGFK